MNSAVLTRSTGQRAGAASSIAVAALLALTVTPQIALADNCLDRVQTMATRFKVATSPPTVPPAEARKPLNSEELGKSGGVIEPPPTPDRSVITPPRTADSNMPTMPDVVPPTAKIESTDAKTLDAAQMASLEALLVAARAQGERGMEADCLEGLRKAQEVVERRP